MGSSQILSETPTNTFCGKPTPQTRAKQIKGCRGRNLDKGYLSVKGTSPAPEGLIQAGVEEVDFTRPDFTKYLEDKITKYHHDHDKIAKDEGKRAVLGEDEVVTFLKKADIRFMNELRTKKPPKRLVSRKKSVFRNGTKRDAEYTFRKSAEDSVIAQVTTRSGYSFGVIAGISAGAPIAKAGIKGIAKYSNTRAESSGSTETLKREMEAKATIGMGEKLIAIESVYHCDYDAECEFDFTVNKEYKFKYDLKTGREKGWKRMAKRLSRETGIGQLHIDVEQIGFEDCEQELTEDNCKKVHYCATFQTTLTDIRHKIEFSIKKY